MRSDSKKPLTVQLSNHIHKIQRCDPVSNFTTNSKEKEVKYGKV